MGFKLFDELSIEEVVAPVATESTLAIEDVMEADIATEEVQEVAAEIAAYGRAIEDGGSVAARLEDQIAVESALVAEPEKVAASTVVLSYESLKVTAAVLGADLGAMSISTEAMEKSPVSALEISIEEKESFLKKVVAKIKAILKKIADSVKKLVAKIVIAVSGVEKKATALEAKVKALDEKLAPKKLSEKTVAAIQAKYGVMISKGIDAVNVKAIIDVAGGDKATSIAKALETMSASVEKALGELGDDAKANGAKVKEVVAAAEKVITDNAKDFGATEVKGEVISASGNTVKYAMLALPEVKDEVSKAEAVSAIKAIKVTLGNATVSGEKAEVSVIGKSVLEAIAGAIVTEAKEVKKYSGEYKKLQEAGDKIVKDIEGTKLAEDVQPGLSGVLSSVQTVNGQVITSLIFGYLGALKDGMNVVNMIAGEYKAEKKEDKKEEK